MPVGRRANPSPAPAPASEPAKPYRTNEEINASKSDRARKRSERHKTRFERFRVQCSFYDSTGARILSAADKWAIVGMLRIGGTRADACRHVGASTQVLRREIERDDMFRLYIEQAEVDAKANALKKIHKSDDWRAGLAYLERKHADEWSAKQATDRATIAAAAAIAKKLLTDKLEAAGFDQADILEACEQMDVATSIASPEDLRAGTAKVEVVFDLSDSPVPSAK